MPQYKDIELPEENLGGFNGGIFMVLSKKLKQQEQFFDSELKDVKKIQHVKNREYLNELENNRMTVEEIEKRVEISLLESERNQQLRNIAIDKLIQDVQEIKDRYEEKIEECQLNEERRNEEMKEMRKRLDDYEKNESLRNERFINAMDRLEKKAIELDEKISYAKYAFFAFLAFTSFIQVYNLYSSFINAFTLRFLFLFMACFGYIQEFIFFVLHLPYQLITIILSVLSSAYFLLPLSLICLLISDCRDEAELYLMLNKFFPKSKFELPNKDELLAQGMSSEEYDEIFLPRITWSDKLLTIKLRFVFFVHRNQDTFEFLIPCMVFSGAIGIALNFLSLIYHTFLCICHTTVQFMS